jgi:hypothetical protein
VQPWPVSQVAPAGHVDGVMQLIMPTHVTSH